MNQRRALYLMMIAFLLEPLPFGAWLALIPYVQTTLELSKAELAFALLGMPIALLPAVNITSRLVMRHGPRRLLLIGFALQAGSIFLPLYSVGQLTLFLSLAVFGISVALLQIGLNVYAGRFERATGWTVMSRCHGFWALGVMLGSGLMTIRGDLSILTMMAAIVVSATAVGCWAVWQLPSFGAAPTTYPLPPRRTFRAMPAALFIIAGYALATSMTEGAMLDWAAVYLAERLGGQVAQAGIAVTIFSGFLALGRFGGDWAKDRFGVVALARAAITCVMLGLVLLIAPLPVQAAYVGFALIGLGASVGYPLAVSAVAALDDVYEGANIATLSMVTVVGFLVGPPLIGLLADLFSLRIGLSALLPGLILSLVAARALNRT